MNAELHMGDMGEAAYRACLNAGLVGWDIETSGLMWSSDRIGTCQVAIPSYGCVIVKLTGAVPRRMKALLENHKTRKIFHHAMFDLKFMSHHWRCNARNAACTKIASKLLDPRVRKRHSLQSVLRRHLGVRIRKEMRVSDWTSNHLSPAQLRYAVRDVEYLLPLFAKLREALEAQRLWSLAQQCFAHLPTRVALETAGYGDVFAYE